MWKNVESWNDSKLSTVGNDPDEQIATVPTYHTVKTWSTICPSDPSSVTTLLNHFLYNTSVGIDTSKLIVQKVFRLQQYW